MSYSGGYLGKLLRVDLSTRSVRTEAIDPRLVSMLLGGRGLAAKYYYDEIPASVGALEKANKLFFFTGPLTGLPLPSTTKFQLATRSPETRRYLCSNCGGDFGPRLKMAGFDALIVEGKAADWTYLTITDGKVAFGDARPWRGYSSTRTLEELKSVMGGGKIGAMSIGPAGERLVHGESAGICRKYHLRNALSRHVLVEVRRYRVARRQSRHDAERALGPYLRALLPVSGYAGSRGLERLFPAYRLGRDDGQMALLHGGR
jgi:aldehyde:ferredoxin oxidoreductase